MRKFQLITRPDCIWCDRAKALLASIGAEYTEIALSGERARTLMESLGAKTVPQIYEGDRHIGGFTDLIEYL